VAVRQRTLGETVRKARVAKEVSLRGFATLLKVSPTFVSMLERDEIRETSDGSLSIKEETIMKIAELLDLESDDLLALAGKLPPDLPEIIHQRPREMAALLRTARGLSREGLAKITEKAKQQKKKSK